MYSNKYENECQCICYTNWYARYVKSQNNYIIVVSRFERTYLEFALY